VKSSVRDVRGFTLLELTISITLLGVIMTLVFGAMRLGGRTWEKGRAETLAWQRRQAAMDLMSRQLGSIYLPEGGLYVQTPVFSGEADRIHFLSTRSLAAGDRRDLVRVHYRIDRDRDGTRRLLFAESRPNLPHGLRKEEPDEEWKTLADGFSRMEFAYLDRVPADGAPPEWSDRWRSAARKGPRALRVTCQWQTDAPPLELVVPVARSGASFQ